MIRMNLLNTAGKQITTLSGIRRKLLIGEAGHDFKWDRKKVIDKKSRLIFK